MISLAEAFAQAIKDAKKDGSWYKMINSLEFIDKMNREYEDIFIKKETNK